MTADELIEMGFKIILKKGEGCVIVKVIGSEWRNYGCGAPGGYRGTGWGHDVAAALASLDTVKIEESR